ncbi:MAG: PAS domain S-box protein [Desulfobacteraceae bacterium]|jgi:PAS domain S-box-containing protein
MNSSDKLSEERYRAFIENVHDGVYETDVHGNFTYFNNSFCRVFGYPREEIQFHNYRKFMDNQNARKAYDAFTRVFVTRKGFSDIIWEIIDKDDQKRIIEISANLITNKAGKKVGFRGIARDVTERFKMLEALKESEYRYQCQYEISREAERQYRTLLDFVPYPMVVFRLDGKVTYLNPAFTEIFGWNLGELQGKKIPYVPPGLEQDTSEIIEKLLRDKTVMRHETKRLTKDGRILDVVLRGAIFSEDGDEEGGQLVLLRDITQEKRMARTNETLLRISMALPAYPVLEDLLDYISSEIKRLLNTEGALVILLDEERNELFFKGAAYDDITTEERAKEIRFPASKGVSGKVIKIGEPIIVLDTAKDPNFYPVVDEQLQFHTRNLLDVPLRSGDRIIGVLMALNKKEGAFDQTDVELLSMIGGTLALSIENARVSKALKEAYGEVTSLNRAKDKVINHLSHELKTPVSVLSASLNIISKKLATQSDDTWKPTVERAQRNLQRLLEIQYQVADIMRDKEYKAYERLSSVLDQTADELEALIAEEVGEVGVMERVRKRIEKTFGPKETVPEETPLDQYVKERLEALEPSFSHRQVEIRRHLEPAPPVCIPLDDLRKVIDGLIKNAIENTPDEGEIEVIVKKKGEGSELVVRDYGVGITEENQKRIFEGFFTTQETMAYSSKRPFDFNAGGKGADLLRMKIFSERYNFKIDMESSRCPCLPNAEDVCPGRISQCEYCKGKPECHRSGGTTFTVFFPPSPQDGCTIETLPGAA